MLGLGLGLGLSGAACDTNDAADNAATPDGLPALTAQEAAAVDNMNKNTLARLEAPVSSSPDGIARTSSELASSIDQTWFSNTFCHVAGADWTWCYATAWQGAWAQKKTHRSNSVTCGDTGAARVNFHQNGTLKTAFDVPYGQCWYSGNYHGAHGLLGVNLETTQKYSVPFAASTVRFAGWMADEDQFIGKF
jgi:hypothetical protein